MATVSHGIDAGYRLTVREFPGSLEIVTKCINHTLEQGRSRDQGIRGKSRPVQLTEEEQQLKEEENRVRSVRRAKQAVRWQIQRLEADHLLTLSYRENMQDVDKLKHDFDRFRRLMHARYPEWRYVAARELQDRGAWHLHLAVKGRQDLNYIRTCWYTVLGCLGATGDNTLGQVNIEAPRKRFANAGNWKAGKLANYLTKYIDKGFDGLEHSSKRYWASKGAPKPVITRYWLSGDKTQIILDTFDIAMYHGMEDFPSALHQSLKHNLIYMQGLRSPLIISGNGIL